MTRNRLRGKPSDFDIDTMAIDAIRTADHFLASLFIGRGQYKIEKRATVVAAREAARALNAEPGFTRRAIIYAVSADGRATMLTDALINSLEAQYKSGKAQR